MMRRGLMVTRVDGDGRNYEAELLVVDDDDAAVVVLELNDGERLEIDREAWEELKAA